MPLVATSTEPEPHSKNCVNFEFRRSYNTGRDAIAAWEEQVLRQHVGGEAMNRSKVLGLVVCAGALTVGMSQPASAGTYVASATGRVSDDSNPLDGIGDTASGVGDLIRLMQNANDTDPQMIVDRRGVFEIDATDVGVHFTEHAFVQFDVFGSNSPFPVNIYLFSGDGVVSAADYGRTEHPVFSGVLVDDEPLIDVTPQLRQLLDEGSDWIGVLIAMSTEDQALVIDNIDGHGIEPSITTKTVPEPATLVLLAAFPLSVLLRRNLRSRP